MEALKIKGKRSHYRPGQILRVQGGWGSQISRQSAPEGGKIISPKHRPPLPPGNIPSTHFCWRLSQPQGHSAAGRIMSMKNPVTPSGTEPATFRLVAQCLNQLRHRVPQTGAPTCVIHPLTYFSSLGFWWWYIIFPIIILNLELQWNYIAKTPGFWSRLCFCPQDQTYNMDSLRAAQCLRAALC